MNRLHPTLAAGALAFAALTRAPLTLAQTAPPRVEVLQAQLASLQDQFNALQGQLAQVASHPVLALGPFVRVDPNPEAGVAGPNVVFSGANLHVVSSGRGNTAAGCNASVSGGSNNTAGGLHAVVLGGLSNGDANANAIAPSVSP